MIMIMVMITMTKMIMIVIKIMIINSSNNNNNNYNYNNKKLSLWRIRYDEWRTSFPLRAFLPLSSFLSSLRIFLFLFRFFNSERFTSSYSEKCLIILIKKLKDDRFIKRLKMKISLAKLIKCKQIIVKIIANRVNRISEIS